MIYRMRLPNLKTLRRNKNVHFEIGTLALYSLFSANLTSKNQSILLPKEPNGARNTRSAITHRITIFNVEH